CKMLSAVRVSQPKKIYTFWSKFLGGSMWFWILWRLKHDWPDVVGHHHVLKDEAEGHH
ncbi:predicted protein, partial [Nematostella vectensis]